MKVFLLLAVLLGVLASTATAAYCPFRPEENCDDFWGGNAAETTNEPFWNFYTCAARGFPATPGSPCYDTSMIRELSFADPSQTAPNAHYDEADIDRLFSLNGEDSLGFWNQVQREGQINRPRTENWGHIGHIALFQTGSGKPFLVNHGNLPFTRSRQGRVEVVTENLSSEARWSVCETADCSVVTEPKLFTDENDAMRDSSVFATYFNWNPCGQSSSTLLWRNGQQVLTFVGVGSRASWTDGRVVMAQCVDSDCSDVDVIEIGRAHRELPGVEHQCLPGFGGVGARIAVAADGNPSIMWRNKDNSLEIVYVHCLDTQCSEIESPATFSLDNEAVDGAAAWWDLISSERGIWLVSLGSSSASAGLEGTPFAGLASSYVQVVSCDGVSCGSSGSQFPQPSTSFSWDWDTNGDDVAFLAQTYSAGVTGDGYPMWVGQTERGPQSSVAWVVCSCRDDECSKPVCHFLADSNSIMDPTVSQCASVVLDPAVVRYTHSSSRQRILSGASNGLPIIAQQISSVCVEILPDPVVNRYGEMSANRLVERLDELNNDNTTDRLSHSGTSFGATRRVLLRSQKTLYINCLDATCSEASVSALESPRASSVSHESGYNQVDSAVVANDQILTVYSPDATADEQSYSWSSACEYDLFSCTATVPNGGDSSIEIIRRGLSGTYTPGSYETTGYYPLIAFDNSGNTLLIADAFGSLTGEYAVSAFGEDTIRRYFFAYDLTGYIDSTAGTIYPVPLGMSFDSDSEVLLVAFKISVNGGTDTGVVVVQFKYSDRQFDTATGTTLGKILFYAYQTDRFGTSVCNSFADYTGSIATVPIAGELLQNVEINGFHLSESILVFFGYCETSTTPSYFAISRRASEADNGAVPTIPWATIPSSLPDAASGPVAGLAWDAINQHIIVARQDTSRTTMFITLGPVEPVLAHPPAVANDIVQLYFPAALYFSVKDIKHPFNAAIAFRKSGACSPSNNPNYGGAVLGGLSAVASVPNFVLLREFLGITPTPRTGGIKTWLTNRWSSPNGQPCEESQASKLVAADDVVFLCSGVHLGDSQRWGSSAIEGWTRFWEWQDISWGLRWRWQGDVHFGTDHSQDGPIYSDVEGYYSGISGVP